LSGKPVAVVLSGGNMDPTMFAGIMERQAGTA
jgi:hypothetical protein